MTRFYPPHLLLDGSLLEMDVGNEGKGNVSVDHCHGLSDYRTIPFRVQKFHCLSSPTVQAMAEAIPSIEIYYYLLSIERQAHIWVVHCILDCNS